MKTKFKKVKNPMFFVFLNWILIILFNWGIPLKFNAQSIDISVDYIVSFIAMNFDLFGSQSNIIIISVAWIITDAIFIIFFKFDRKYSFKILFSQLFLLILEIIFVNSIDKELNSNLLQDNIAGFFVGFALILVLISPMFLVCLIEDKLVKIGGVQSEISKVFKSPILKCPHCGQEFDSNPLICFNCSKEI